MSAVSDSAVTRLESVLGANAIFVAKAANRELYAIDGIAPTAFAKPASAEQAGEIVRFAAKENLSFSSRRPPLGVGRLGHDITAGDHRADLVPGAGDHHFDKMHNQKQHQQVGANKMD